LGFLKRLRAQSISDIININYIILLNTNFNLLSIQKTTYTYKQWTDEYVEERDTEITLENRQSEILESERANIEKLKPDPYNELNQEFREYQIGKEFISKHSRAGIKHNFNLKSLWTGGKFAKSVYIDQDHQ
jgi:hypothetical protein